jgi:hypothetical protein
MRSRLAAGLVAVLCMTACRDLPTSAAAPLVSLASGTYTIVDSALMKRLARGSVFAEGSYLACVQSYYAQGISLHEIRTLCGAKLDSLDLRGWGNLGQGLTLPPNTRAGFDPSQVVSSCSAGNPKLSSGSLEKGRLIYNSADRSTDYGTFSWGGKGESPAPGFVYRGLTEQESQQEKLDNARAAEQALTEWMGADIESQDDPGNKDKQARAAELKAAYDTAKKKADADPNLVKKVTPGSNDPVVSLSAGESTCTQVLQLAREFVGECQRTGWKHISCQQLHANVNKCPDPTQIFVDPDAGYACAATVDPQLVIDAWQKACEENTTPGPDGGSPCSKPTPSESGHTMQGNEKDMCSNPYALTDPESAGCFRPLELDPFGRPDIPALIVWGQGAIGGPIIVLPLPRPPFVVKGR